MITTRTSVQQMDSEDLFVLSGAGPPTSGSEKQLNATLFPCCQNWLRNVDEKKITMI